MGWWATLREGRNLRPNITAPTNAPVPPRMSEAIREWMNVAFSGDVPAEREAAALAALRADPTRTIQELRALYEQTPHQDHSMRWALVYAAGQLDERAAIGFLEDVLRAPIPPERSRDIHHFSSVVEEVVMRCCAVEALASLAAKGDREALEALLHQLRHPSFSIRATACLSLRELPGVPVSEAQIRERLAPEQSDRVLALRRGSMNEAVVPTEPGARTPLLMPPGTRPGVEPAPSRRRPPRIRN